MYLQSTPPVVVEYDGTYWHQDREDKDSAKSADLAVSGHVVVRIRESPLLPVTSNDVACFPAMIEAFRDKPGTLTRPDARCILAVAPRLPWPPSCQCGS